MASCLSRSLALAAGLVVSSSALAFPARVLVLSSGDAPLDEQVIDVLRAEGHFPTLGPSYTLFVNEGNILSGFDVIYVQASANWQAGDMPQAGQFAIVNFVHAGGGLLTTEWALWKNAWRSDFAVLQPLFAAEPTIDFSEARATNYRQVTFDPDMSAGLPATFRMVLNDFDGTESRLLPRPGAVEFYSTDTYEDGGGVVGVARGAGRVVNISVVAGQTPLAGVYLPRVLGNAIDWLNPFVEQCAADFNDDGFVNSQDLFDFMAAFFILAPSADFNWDGLVNTQDFFDYLGEFFAGCN